MNQGKDVGSMPKKKKDNDQPVFEMLKNSDLTCRDCILVGTTDDKLVISCDKFTIKPRAVLDGGECTEKITELDLLKKENEKDENN